MSVIAGLGHDFVPKSAQEQYSSVLVETDLFLEYIKNNPGIPKMTAISSVYKNRYSDWKNVENKVMELVTSGKIVEVDEPGATSYFEAKDFHEKYGKTKEKIMALLASDQLSGQQLSMRLDEPGEIICYFLKIMEKQSEIARNPANKRQYCLPNHKYEEELEEPIIIPALSTAELFPRSSPIKPYRSYRSPIRQKEAQKTEGLTEDGNISFVGLDHSKLNKDKAEIANIPRKTRNDDKLRQRIIEMIRKNS